MNSRFFASATDVCLLQGRQRTVEKHFLLHFCQASAQLFQINVGNVSRTLAWKIKTESGIFFYPLFKNDIILFKDNKIRPLYAIENNQFFMYGANLFKFFGGVIWKCVIFGNQEIATAFALASGLFPVNLRLAKVLHLNKVLALEWIFDDNNSNLEFYLPVFADEYLNLRHAKGGICAPLEFGYQEFSCGEPYSHNNEIWFSKIDDKGRIELFLSPLSMIKP